MVETVDDTAAGTNPTAYQPPDWWLRSRDVGFVTWSSDGPYHGVPDLVPTTLVAVPSRMDQWMLFASVAIAVAIAFVGTYQAGLRQGRRESMKLLSLLGPG